ncbi:choice-of-anchor L family PEP-CTERM protein [Eleftheria terrae]|uniref:choice-of-anchor L family PEP-CTERM protein n=1 Tax=Eleftheria terrae TaxID=1597781 RepID=UPI00263B8158|nr:choice-of-anchor L domain-containing protein [Eleftheria terrae]WKB51782.1 choice-of-anchor L domain-containing protein [Eleftheria terrae]
MKHSLVMCLTALAAGAAQAQLAITETDNRELLLGTLLGASSGLSVVAGSVSGVGLPTQSGLYSGFSFTGDGTDLHPDLSINDGIVLSSGAARVPEHNTLEHYGVWAGTGNNERVDAILGQPNVTWDTNSLKFDFTVAAGTTSVSTDFIFASDEFAPYSYYTPGQVGTDGFAFLVDGVNYARFPAPHGPIFNYQNVPDWLVSHNQPELYGIEWDGIVPRLTVTGLLDPNRSVHTLELVLYDYNDPSYDSAVYLSGLQAGQSLVGGIPAPVPEPQTWALLAAGLGIVAALKRRR